MPIAVFENSKPRTLTFIIEPSGERYEVPHLAKIGVRYALDSGATDQTYTSVDENLIIFSCDSSSWEVEMVLPKPFDRMIWDICVNGGFCGGIMKGEPMHVTYLLPTAGTVTAEEFATLVIRADGDDEGTPDQRRAWMARLEAQFFEHMGATSVPAEQLTLQLKNPFD